MTLLQIVFLLVVVVLTCAMICNPRLMSAMRVGQSLLAGVRMTLAVMIVGTRLVRHRRSHAVRRRHSCAGGLLARQFSGRRLERLVVNFY
jgi:hypothetical protein